MKSGGCRKTSAPTSKSRSQKEAGKEGIVDKHNRFVFGTPPASNGDFAYIQHILASLNNLVVLESFAHKAYFSGGNLRSRKKLVVQRRRHGKDSRRKADDEYLIRTGILNNGWLDPSLGCR